MSSENKTFEEMLNELPADSRAKIRNFVEYLFEKNVKDLDFRRDLELACQHVFAQYQQSAYDTWQDLQQDVLLRLWRFQPSYCREGEARSNYLTRIATNVLIEAARKGSAKSHSRKRLRQTWAGALRHYRSQYSSLDLQKKALDWRGD
jgi:DNA-directed RNA polymerase specialized sigma24 family protein